MLAYLGTGFRDYARRPPRVISRNTWEFQAVLSGKIGMVGPTDAGTLKERTLWVSGPTHVHGWTGELKNQARIAAFQFLAVPRALTQILPGDGDCMTVRLTQAQCRQIQRLGDEGRLYWERPRAGRLVCFEHVLTELTLLVLGSQPENQGEVSPRINHPWVRVWPTGKKADPGAAFEIGVSRANKAAEWFAKHLKENPGLTDIARSVGISVAQLRRDFHRWGNQPPSNVFTEIRLQHAIELVVGTHLTLEQIAEECGYRDPGTFSRAFKRKFGASPKNWRTESSPPYMPRRLQSAEGYWSNTRRPSFFNQRSAFS